MIRESERQLIVSAIKAFAPSLNAEDILEKVEDYWPENQERDLFANGMHSSVLKQGLLNNFYPMNWGGVPLNERLRYLAMEEAVLSAIGYRSDGFAYTSIDGQIIYVAGERTLGEVVIGYETVDANRYFVFQSGEVMLGADSIGWFYHEAT